MKKIIRNTFAALALIAGLVIGAVCQGLLAFIGAFALTYGGLITLIAGNTRWIWTA